MPVGSGAATPSSAHSRRQHSPVKSFGQFGKSGPCVLQPQCAPLDVDQVPDPTAGSDLVLPLLHLDPGSAPPRSTRTSDEGLPVPIPGACITIDAIPVLTPISLRTRQAQSSPAPKRTCMSGAHDALHPQKQPSPAHSPIPERDDSRQEDPPTPSASTARRPDLPHAASVVGTVGLHRPLPVSRSAGGVQAGQFAEPMSVPCSNEAHVRNGARALLLSSTSVTSASRIAAPM